MSTFRVDPDVLRTISERLASVGDEIAGAAVTSCPNVDVGSNTLADSVQSFQDAISRGLADLGDDMTAATGLIREAATSYQSADDATRQAAQSSTGPAPTAGATP